MITAEVTDTSAALNYTAACTYYVAATIKYDAAGARIVD